MRLPWPAHKNHPRAAFAVVSPDPPAEQAAFAAARGRRFNALSGQGNSFTQDVGFEKADGSPMKEGGPLMVRHKFLGAWAGYVVTTFAGGAVWHLLLFKRTYIALKIFSRIEDPVIPLGVSAMVIQGAILAYIYPLVSRRLSPAREGVRFGALAGLFLATSAVLAEAGKNYVTSLGTWLVLETTYYLLQFMLSGLVIGLAYGRNEAQPQSQGTA